MSIVLNFNFKSEADRDDFQKWVDAHPNAEGEQIIAHAKSYGAHDGNIELAQAPATQEEKTK